MVGSLRETWAARVVETRFDRNWASACRCFDITVVTFCAIFADNSCGARKSAHWASLRHESRLIGADVTFRTVDTATGHAISSSN